ncbi:MAG: BREX-1 system phosphatase PglZ type B, partial [Candidatus Marinimicrobia bacterium]|nr:BREX-1 system phosphatase PglZ type B [Candidatus Neomarinimicrobiota bacterium]
IGHLIVGHESSADFEPQIKATGKPAKHQNHMKLLQDNGWQVLKRTELGDPDGKAWTEIDSIDKAGHSGNLPQQIDGIIKEIRDRIRQLMDAGWSQVKIVTDHGWLFLPNGLPKIALPKSLTENQWGRCASLKVGVSTPDKLFPWFWNPNHHFALADGISCFRAGIKYAHGGLSLQECLTLHLVVSQSTIESVSSSAVITEIGWRGLRCDVIVEGGSSEMVVDIRLESDNPDTSIVLSQKALEVNDKTSLLIPNDGLLGQSATVVIITSAGQLVSQTQIVIGGDN